MIVGFDYAQCRIGMNVEVDFEPTMPEPTLGQIAQVYDDCVNIVMTDSETGNQRILLQCRHRDDPKVHDHNWFNEHMRLQTNDDGVALSGVFVLAAMTQATIQMAKDAAEARMKVEALERRLDALQNQLARGQTPPERKKRGRPPGSKNRPELPESDESPNSEFAQASM